MRWGASSGAPLVPLGTLRSGPAEGPLVQHALAGRADLALDLERDAGPLTEDVLRDLRVAVRPLCSCRCHFSQASSGIGGCIPQSGDDLENFW
jgi:hypothetical protein